MDDVLQSIPWWGMYLGGVTSGLLIWPVLRLGKFFSRVLPLLGSSNVVRKGGEVS
jgi:hypothetical protein